jgi:O-antigen/teichoic acid export membrane protein
MAYGINQRELYANKRFRSSMNLKEILWITIGRIAQFALLLITLRIATTYLSPAEMGKVSIVTATVAFFALFLINPVGMFINRRFHAWNSRGQVKAYIAYFWIYLVLVSMLAALVLIFVVFFNIWDFGITINWLLLLVCGGVFIGTVNQFSIPSLNMLGHRGWFTILTVATVGSSLFFAVLLVEFVSMKAEYWLSGLLVGQLIVGLVGKRVLFEKLSNESSGDFSVRINYSKLNSLVHFAWPVAIAVGLGWVQSQGYRYIIQGRLGLDELGLFAAGFGISSGLISGFEAIFSAYFQPKFYERVSLGDDKEQSQAWVDYAKITIPALLLTAFLIVSVAPELTNLLLGSGYKESAQFIVWGALAEFGRISTAVFGMLAHARMNTKMLLLPNLAGAVAAILLISVLAPLYGSIGVGLGLALSSVVGFFVTYYISGRYFKVIFRLYFLRNALISGLVIIVFSEILNIVFGGGVGYLVSIIKLFAIGSIFVIFQYFMLAPALKIDTSSLRRLSRK